MLRGERRLFRDLDLDIHAGRAVHLKGPNGSGKTTLLRILCGFLRPTEGRLRVDAREVEAGAPELRALIGFLGHADGLKLELDALENLQFARTVGGHPPLADPLELLAQVDLARHAQVATRRLSAGQRRRLGIARMMACEHRIWILDEPFTALDTAGMEELSRILESVLDAGAGVVFTSHQASPLAARRTRVTTLAGA